MVPKSNMRKKRRTRKCLDEIRNRSRRTLERRNIQHQKMDNKNIKYPLITTERLTLQSVFPKAIRSETVTRPILEEFKYKNGRNVKEIECNTSSNCLPLYRESLCESLTRKKFNNNDSLPDCEGTRSVKDTEYRELGALSACSSKQFTNYSTGNTDKPSLTKEGADEYAVESRRNTTRGITSGAGSPASHSNNTHHDIYEELMSEIPSYFRRVTTSMFKHDPIKNTVNNLRKLYLENCQKYENNIIFKDPSGEILAPKKTIQSNREIIENPLDYIKLGDQRFLSGSSLAESDRWSINIDQAYMVSLGSNDSKCVSTTSPSSERSTASPGVNSRSMSSSGSGQLSAHPATCTLDTLVYQTPDYNYYPHRLN